MHFGERRAGWPGESLLPGRVEGFLGARAQQVQQFTAARQRVNPLVQDDAAAALSETGRWRSALSFQGVVAVTI
jgi:hypothetical protein